MRLADLKQANAIGDRMRLLEEGIRRGADISVKVLDKPVFERLGARPESAYAILMNEFAEKLVRIMAAELEALETQLGKL